MAIYIHISGILVQNILNVSFFKQLFVFFPALLRYNGQTKLYIFKVYEMTI